MSKKRNRLLILLIVVCFLIGTLGLDFYIKKSTNNQIFASIDQLPTAFKTILIPGAGIVGDEPGKIYQERLNTALHIIQKFPKMKVIISADNSKKYYNETAVGMRYLLNHGVQTGNIFLDFAGFDTYDSIYRAKAIFEASNLIIVSQKFALPRALFIANQLHMQALGIIAGEEEVSFRNFLREKLANLKALYETTCKVKPHFLGEVIPIDGPSNIQGYLNQEQNHEA